MNKYRFSFKQASAVHEKQPAAYLSGDRTNVIEKRKKTHPNCTLTGKNLSLIHISLKADGSVIQAWTVYSVGGGALASDDLSDPQPEHVYGMSTVSEIQQWCDKQGGSYWEYVQQCEGDEIWDYLEEV